MKSNFPAPRLGTARLADLFAAFLAALFTTLPAQAAPPVDYGGHYELLTTGKNPGRQYSLEVLQTGSRADVGLSPPRWPTATAPQPRARGRGMSPTACSPSSSRTTSPTKAPARCSGT
ncbi:MAG: hypothetical protein WDO13_00010 [Verrucomicrobiota bacterium]